MCEFPQSELKRAKTSYRCSSVVFTRFSGALSLIALFQKGHFALHNIQLFADFILAPPFHFAKFISKICSVKKTSPSRSHSPHLYSTCYRSNHTSPSRRSTMMCGGGGVLYLPLTGLGLQSRWTKEFFA